MIQAIIEGISNALFTEFGFENHMEQIKQGLEGPCFFIQCINPSFKRYPGNRYFQQSQFAVQYFPESEYGANAECYAVAGRMCLCLEMIQAGGGSIRGTKMNYRVEDGVLSFFVNYDCFLRLAEEQEAMGSMERSIYAKG